MHYAITHPMIPHPYHPDLITGEGVAAVASAAESAGFSGFRFTDHPAPTQQWLDTGGHHALDPFVALGFAAARTSKLRLIPNIVVLPYRNPFLVAKAGATLDRLSGGRFTLAVGAGYLRGEFAALGVDFDERVQLLDEGIDVIRAIWTGDDISYEGMHFTACGITAHPRPMSRPHPPIWIGGNAGSARQRVAVRGDGWCPFRAQPALADMTGTAVLDGIDHLAAGIDDLRRRCDVLGRDWSQIDVVFTNHGASAPGRADFNADTYLSRMEKLAAIGVTWLQVPMPGDSLTHLLEAIDQFRAEVIEVDRREGSADDGAT